MNPPGRHKLPAATRRLAALAAAFLATLCGLTLARHASARQLTDSPLVVHEWGTFTSIAGIDGAAVWWLPFPAESDLPAFVEHTGTASFKGGLCGTVRMETPVIYFYSPRQTTVSVDVRFAKGLFTEWFPHAARVGPSDAHPAFLDAKTIGSIVWPAVTITPAANASFLREATPSHYYAARETSANTVSIAAPAGNQVEKFLFYRGVAAFSPPLSAKVLADGQLQIENSIQNNAAAIAPLILFERRGDKLGYRVIPAVEASATWNTPSTSGTVDSLRSDFEDLLVTQGLFRDEARAMLETWRDSWFEEGSRLFYIVPRAFVDSVLPLSIHPAPSQLTRVFVGRIELVTPATENTVEAALLSRDHETLQRYGRFLGPIAEIITAKHTEPGRANRLRQALGYYYSWLYSAAKSPR
jgi:hypothetical protein